MTGTAQQMPPGAEVDDDAEVISAADFFLGGGVVDTAIGRIAMWDEYTAPRKGWLSLECAHRMESAKKNQNPVVIRALETAMRMAMIAENPGCVPESESEVEA